MRAIAYVTTHGLFTSRGIPAR